MKIRVRTDSLRQCQNPRCLGKSSLIIRHHMGNDRLLGLYSVQIRKQYFEYHDTVNLCDDCHMEIHWHYHMVLLSNYKLLTAKGVMRLRQVFINYCKVWLGPTGKTKKVPGQYRKKWKARVARWQKSR